MVCPDTAGGSEDRRFRAVMRRGAAGLETGGFRVFRSGRLDHIRPPAVRKHPDFHAENDRGPDHPVFAGLRRGQFAVSPGIAFEKKRTQ